MAQNPYQIWQAGDGRHYKINAPMVQQLCAAAVGAQLKNQNSKVVSTYSPSGWFGGTKTFQSVEFDGKHARSQFEGLMMQRYNEFWVNFEGSGGAAVNKLLQYRRHALVHGDALAEKFKQCAKTNGESLKSLDSNVTVAKAVRDGGFTVVAAMATGGVGTGVISLSTGGSILVGGATVKAGAKFYDLKCEGKLSDSMSVGLIGVDYVSDLMFGAVGLTQAAAGKDAAMTAKQAFLFILCTKAPLEMAKTAAGGGSLSQIALSGGFEAAGPLFDKFKEAFGNTLIPCITKVTVGASVDGALSAAKDIAQSKLAPTAQVGSSASWLETLLAFFAFFNMSDEQFIKRYIVVPV